MKTFLEALMKMPIVAVLFDVTHKQLRIDFCWFVVGFVLMVVGSFGFGWVVAQYLILLDAISKTLPQ